MGVLDWIKEKMSRPDDSADMQKLEADNQRALAEMDALAKRVNLENQIDMQNDLIKQRNLAALRKEGSGR